MSKKLSEWALIEATKEFFVWLIPKMISWSPVSLGVGTGVVGWLQEIPWFWILVGMSVVMGQGMTSLVRYYDWRERNRVEHKLTFQDVRVQHRLDSEGRVTWIRVGVLLKNMANFPLAFEVHSMTTSVNGMYPPNKPYIKNDTVVPEDGIPIP